MRFIIINRTGIKKIIKIAWRVLLGLLLTVYVVVALVNFSVVQSMVGSVVSARLAERTGGTVQVGSIGCNPFNHLTLRNVLMVTPEGDTVCKGHTIAMRFRSFPYDKHGLSLSQLRLKDVNYHLAIDTMGINLRYIIEAFASHEEEEEEEDDGEPSEFKVLVDDLIMDNVWYRQDLKETPGRVPDRGSLAFRSSRVGVVACLTMLPSSEGVSPTPSITTSTTGFVMFFILLKKSVISSDSVGKDTANRVKCQSVQRFASTAEQDFPAWFSGFSD